jgi:tellurite resistance protein TerC
MHVSLTWWVGTLAAVAVLMVADLVVNARVPPERLTRRSVRWVTFYIAVALVFALLLGLHFGPGYAGQFMAGWLTEYSLSVDNLFIFLILITRFHVPPHLQLRVLTSGVFIALVLRGALIAVGAVALARFSWLFSIFGVFLLYTAWTMLRDEHVPDTDENGEPPVPKTVSLLNRVLPTTPVWHGTRLTARQQGARVVTPMLLTMLAIGVTDVLFALDSIPAIFGLTTEPFLVICANAFALLGLRQLFFVVRGLLDRLEHLSRGLSVVLAFIGVKLILEALHDNTLGFVNGGKPVPWAPDVPTAVSLGVVVGIIAVTAVTSLVSERRRPDAASGEPADPPDPGSDSGPDQPRDQEPDRDGEPLPTRPRPPVPAPVRTWL